MYIEQAGKFACCVLGQCT